MDGNGHVFSGKYGDIIWDALPPEWQDIPPREFSINYHHEVTLGDTLRMRGCITEHTENGEPAVSQIFMEGRSDKGLSFLSRIIY